LSMGAAAADGGAGGRICRGLEGGSGVGSCGRSAWFL
jgi:hypothetical protein